MKLTCRPTLFTGEQKIRMERESDLMKKLGYHQLDPNMGACKKWIKVDDPDLVRLVELLDESDTLLTDIRWSKSEVEQAAGYHLVCKTMGMSDADNNHQLSVFDSAAALATPSKWGAISVHPNLQINSVKLKAGTLRYLDQWTEELVLAKDVVQAWPEEWPQECLEPVQSRKGQDRSDLYRIVPQVVMPCVSAKTIGHYETWDDGPNKPSTPRFRRALTYDQKALESMPLMARTAEPFGNLGQGLLLVSKEWRQWCIQHKWKGPSFHPLLEWGNPLWEQFAAQWERLLELADKKNLVVH